MHKNFRNAIKECEPADIVSTFHLMPDLTPNALTTLHAHDI